MYTGGRIPPFPGARSEDDPSGEGGIRTMKQSTGPVRGALGKIWGGAKPKPPSPRPPGKPSGPGKPPRGEKPEGATPAPGGGGPPEDPSKGGKSPGGGGGGENPAVGESVATNKQGVGGGPVRAYGGGATWNEYQRINRAHINRLKKDLEEAGNKLKHGSKMFNASSEQMRLEHQKIKTLLEEYANFLKVGLETEAAAMKLSREQATELKLLIDEMKEALKSGKSGRWFNLDKIKEYAKAPNACIQLAKNLTYFGLFVSGALVCLGYLKLDEPSTFTPRDTKAGKMLYDNFFLGMKICCKSSVSASDTITNMLSGELDALQSKLMLQRIEKNWSCSLDIAPGNDMVLKGGVLDMWVKGLNVNVNLPLYTGADRMIEIKMKHPFGSIKGTVGLNSTPLLSLNAMFGNKILSAGALVDYDILHRIVSRVALGGSLDIFGFSASAMLSKVFQPQAAGQQPPQPEALHDLTFSVHQDVSESTSVGAQLIHRLEEHQTTVSVGVEHHLDDVTFVKAKLTSGGVLTGLLQHKIGEKSTVSLCSAVNLTAPNAMPRVGVSICIVP